MIIAEQLSEALEKRYSDKGVMIRQLETGKDYDSAIDVIPCRYTYEETERPVEQTEEQPPEERIAELEEALELALSGGTQ